MKVAKALTLVWILLASCSGNDSKDEDEARKVVVDFYNWYSKKSHTKTPSDFQPGFSQDKSGFATLDFSPYVENLRRMKCSESFIRRELESYSTCMENLKQIPFLEMDNKLEDLSNYEEIGCDFFNSHRFTKSMEGFSGIEIVTTQVQKDKASVRGRIYEDTPDKRYFYANVTVTLLRIGDTWMIDVIEI